MSTHGTALQLHVDGGYVEFQQAVLRALPHDIDPNIADGWRNNTGALAKVLREALLPPEKPKPEPAPLPMLVEIDADLNPNTPSGLFLTGEGTEHRKMGKITLEKRDDGKLYINGVEATLYLSPKQLNGKTIQGHQLRKELKDQQVLNACIFDALRANPQLIPEDWKQDEQGRTRYIYFWGTIFRNADGRLCVRYLYWHGGRWYWLYDWLAYDWLEQRPAASLAS